MKRNNDIRNQNGHDWAIGETIATCRGRFVLVRGLLLLMVLTILMTSGRAWGQAGFTFPLTGTGTGEATLPSGTMNSAPIPLGPMSTAQPQYQTVPIQNGRIYTPDRGVSTDPISVTAAFGWKGNDVGDQEVYILAGDCRISQGSDVVCGPKAVVWVRNREKADAGTVREITVYLEKENQRTPLQIELNSVFVEARENTLAWLGTFQSFGAINLHLAQPGNRQLDPDAIYYRASQMRQTPPNGAVQQISQTNSLSSSLTGTDLSKISGGKNGFRRIRILSRHDYDMTFTMEPMPEDSTKRQCIINSGVTIIIEGIPGDGKWVSDVVDISADRAVIWSKGIEKLNEQNETLQGNEYDLEIFLDGDIVFREGEKIIYANKMYYDAKNHIGLIRDTEMIVPIPDNPGGFFRLKADEVTQRNESSITAKNTWVSTSMMGNPSYRLQSGRLTAESKETPLFDSATRAPLIDPETGRQKMQKEQYIIAENNYVALESVPILYWPWMAMDARDQTLYLRNLNFGNDSIYGFQARTTWNPYQLLNIDRPEGTDWDLNIDYLSKRGLGHGMSFLYNRDSLFGCKNPVMGIANFYGIYDSGEDNLGLGRRSMDFPQHYRYRGIWKHRQMLDNLGWCGDGWVFTGQLGTSSDRNFLPQYFENEWFTSSNPETNFELKQTSENRSLGLGIKYRLDDFYTQTNKLPQLDHYWIGQPLLYNRVVWYEHTKLGYNQFRTATSPYDVEDRELFRYLDWELAADSASNQPNDPQTQTLKADSFNFSTRHELDVPLELGPLDIVPYGLGEFAYWGQGAMDKNITRFYGRGGVRMNLPFWKVDSDVNSQTWYLNGLAHKTNLMVDASYSAVNRDFGDLVMYDALDDWQVEDFRRRYSVTTFGNTGMFGYGDSIPVRFDERYYAIRQGGLAGNVTSPVTEIADNLSLVRMEWQNRWQTKRGPVGKRHIIDWITFDTGVNFYPKKEENFDQYVGLLDYDLRWNVGDRFAVLSSGLYDFFGEGQKITRLGLISKKPQLASLYLGVDRLQGPIDSTYLNASVNYRMSQKWGASVGASYDLSESENVGESVSLSRVGESFIFTLSGNINHSKDNWGVSLSVIPVFLLDKKRKEDAVLNYGSL